MNEKEALEKIMEWWHNKLENMCREKKCNECPYREYCPEQYEDCEHLGYACGEYFCKLRDDIDNLKPHKAFCIDCENYRPKGWVIQNAKRKSM